MATVLETDLFENISTGYYWVAELSGGIIFLILFYFLFFYISFIIRINIIKIGGQDYITGCWLKNYVFSLTGINFQFFLSYSELNKI